MAEQEVDPKLERLKEWLSFWKYFLGTVLIGAAGVVIDQSFKDREIEIQETESMGKYIQHALTEDVGTRKRFAEYFAKVSRSESARGRWEEYLKLVKNEFDSTNKVLDSISKSELVLQKEKAKKIAQVNHQSNPNSKNEIKEIESSFKKAVDSLQLLRADLEAKLQVSKLNTNTEVSRPMIQEVIEVTALHSLLTKFLKQYSTYCFNSARIRDWGGKKREFKEFKSYSYNAIDIALEELKSKGVVITNACDNPNLYKIAD